MYKVLKDESCKANCCNRDSKSNRNEDEALEVNQVSLLFNEDLYQRA